MAFWLTLALWAGSFVIGQLLRPKVQKPSASGISDVDIPTATEARPVPIGYGTFLVKAPNVLWFGDRSTDPLIEGGQTFGYRYRLGLHYGICAGPIDVVQQIYFDERIPYDPLGQSSTFPIPVGGASSFEISINDTDLYGAWNREGGPTGDINFYVGTLDQSSDPYLEEKMGMARPRYLGLCHAVFKSFGIGNSQNCYPVAFELSRWPIHLGIPERIGDYDANPASILYDILTDTRYGLGLSPTLIDEAAFQAVGHTLFGEGCGMSILIEQQGAAEDVIEDILRHIDGTLFADPVSGLISIALARGDYDPNELITLDESSIESLEFSRPSWEDLRNVVRVRYTDPNSFYREGTFELKDLASINATGEMNVEEIQYLGFRNSWVAGNVGLLALRILSYPLARLTLSANRKAQSLRPASVFKLNWPELGISGMICRVTRDGSGTLTDGMRTIEAVEDIFGVDRASYTVPTPI